MTSRIPVHRFAALMSRLTCRASTIAPRCSSHRRLLSDSPATNAAAAKEPRWVMLNSYGRLYRPDDSSFVADKDSTVAESRTSKGRRVRVSFRCATPPSSSYLYYDFPDSARVAGEHEDDRVRVVAAHGDSVLLQMSNSSRYYRQGREDYFVYSWPAGARRPPSLCLLPVPEFPTKPESVPASYFDPPIRRPELGSGGIGLLRRGKNDDLLVVHVDLWYNSDERREMAVFCCVLRSSTGMRRWELMEPVPIEYGLGSSPRHVVCVGDRFLCWVSYGFGFILCDMADEASPKVRYVGLPPEVRCCSYCDYDDRVRVRRMGAAGDSSVRFVSIHPDCCRIVHSDRDLYSNDDDRDCCCRDDGTTCWHHRFVFTIKTWTMNLLSVDDDEPLEWVEDGEIDGEEIWALPGYEGLPQAIPEWPVVCPDKPNVVCFLVSNYHFTRGCEKVWMVHLNITTKTLLSVVQLTSNDDYWVQCYSYHLPAEIQY